MVAIIDDSMPARISPDCPDEVRHVLDHTWAHDLFGLRKIISTTNDASKFRDPKTGETPSTPLSALAARPILTLARMKRKMAV